MPRPCSPEIEPPRPTASSNRSRRGVLGARYLRPVGRVEQHRRVQVAIARVAPAARGETMARADLERPFDRLLQPVERDDDVLAQLPAMQRLHRVRHARAPAPQRPDLLSLRLRRARRVDRARIAERLEQLVAGA